MIAFTTQHSSGRAERILDFIYCHHRCLLISPVLKQKITDAYLLAEELHGKQFRHDKTPYISHVDRSVRLYLDETLGSEEQCDPRYLIALMLHDCIEDSPIGIERILERGFGVETIIDILWMSEPSPEVIAQVEKLKDTQPYYYSEIMREEFFDMYAIVEESNPESYIASDEFQAGFTSEMTLRMKELWYDFYAPRYFAVSDVKRRKEIFTDYVFNLMIASTKMPKEIFRIKATERRDNMQHIEGLLNKEKVGSAKKTMHTTMQVYLPRAQEIRDHRLGLRLIFDRNRERAAFVAKKLIK